MIIIEKSNFAMPKTRSLRLKILIPEDLNYEGLFDEILDRHVHSWKIETVKTKDFGALFELTYRLNVNEELKQKDLIDELRCKNGNLSISLTSVGIEEKVY